MTSSLSLIVVLCLATGLWIGAEAQDSCRPGWSQHGCNCFKYFGTAKAWADAEKHCITQGANLASIHTEVEHQFVRGLIRSATRANSKAYVGGHDHYKEGKWSWSDGSNFKFPGWLGGEPNNAGPGEDCMEINFRNRGNDIPCGLARPFVCSKKV